MNAHPAADLFPMMPDEELQALADDIAANGLNQPIVTHEGKILDGRNRFKACEIADVHPETIKWEDPGCGPVAWVVSQNIQRRHLTATDRSVLAVELLPKLEAEAKERMAEGGRGGIQGPEKVPDLRESRQAASELVQVNERYVSDAKKIANKRPDLFKKMKEGEVTIREATREVNGSPEDNQPPTKRAKPTYSLDTAKGRQVAGNAKERLEAVLFGLEGYALGADKLRIELAVSVASAEEVDAWTRSLVQSLRDLSKLKKRMQRECESDE